MSTSGFQPPELSELQELLPAFGFEHFIAAGGMGAVYQARQLSLDREVAIKILPREFLADAEMREQFSEEAKAMAKLNHPNLIGIYDFGEVDAMPYLVMEFVKGQSLHYSSHGVAIDPQVAVSIVVGIAKGLAHAHEAGILHRDIKPANILLTPDAQPKIGDFGLARALESGSSDAVVFGTPGYTAPEVLTDADLVGKQSDVFSVGVILYELLTGELPGEPFVPASRKVHTHPKLDQIINRAIHPDPARRYPEASSLASDLEAVAPFLKKATLVTGGGSAGKSAPAKLVPGGAPAPSTARPTSKARPTAPLSSSSAGNWNFLRNLVIIVVLLLAIFGVWKAIQFKQDKNQQLADDHTTNQGTSSPPPVKTPPRNPDPTPPVVPDPEPVEPAKTPLEQLAELRPRLRVGDRSAFPEGTHTQGSQAYFLVPTELSWPEATAFAEDHGGHLAVCTNNSFTGWLAGKLPSGTNAWLGAGLVGPNSWGWIDGTDWTGSELSRKLGNVIALSDLGTLRPMDSGTRLPFILQWDLEGANPGTLDEQIKRMKATADSPNPIWPVGTVDRGNRQYLVIGQSLPLGQARTFARKLGGDLAVPSDKLEQSYLLEIVTKLHPEGELCALGGRFAGVRWRWTNGEKWTSAQWSTDAEVDAPAKGSIVCIRSGTTDGWTIAPPNDPPSAFLVEWSTDSEGAVDDGMEDDPGATASISGGVEPTEALLEVRAVALKAYQKHVDTLRNDFSNNRKDFLWAIDFWFRGLSGNERNVVSGRVDRFKAIIEEGEASEPIEDNFTRTNLPGGLVPVLEEHLKKQEDIETAFLDRVDGLRKAYLKELTKKAGEFEEAGNQAEVAALESEVQAVGQSGESLRDHFEISE